MRRATGGRRGPGSNRASPPTGSGVLRRREGFVLIAVLWLVVALGAAGLHAGLAMRTERLAAANVLDQERARQTAQAGAEYARSRLTASLLDRADQLRAEAARADTRQTQTRTPNVQALMTVANPMYDPWRDPAGLMISPMRFGDAIFSLQVRDIQAALHLNGADTEMLTNFFAQGLGLDYAESDRLAQAIADWRDEDDIPRVGGAERAEYLRAGAAMLPADRPFAEIDELRHVLGVTPEIFEAARPYLTLRGSGRININAAPEPVLLALPGMTPAAVYELLQLRQTGVFLTSTQELLRMLPAGPAAPLQAAGRRFSARVAYRTDEVEIIAAARVEGSPVMARLRMMVIRSNSGALVTSREFF